MRFHLHKYKIETEITKGHKHRIFGYAGNMIGLDNIHFHFFYGICSYENHTHYFSGITGMPVKTENGHIHRMDGNLDINKSHKHKFEGFTFEDISYFTSRQATGYAQ